MNCVARRIARADESAFHKEDSPFAVHIDQVQPLWAHGVTIQIGDQQLRRGHAVGAQAVPGILDINCVEIMLLGTVLIDRWKQSNVAPDNLHRLHQFPFLWSYGSLPFQHYRGGATSEFRRRSGSRAHLTILQSLPMRLSAHEKAAQNRRTPKPDGVQVLSFSR